MREPLLEVENRRKAVLLSILCFSIYTVSYIGRLNYSAALVDMIATGVLSKTQGGAIATAYFLCYGAGQLLNGTLADRHNPIRQVTVGVAASVGWNLLMLSTDRYPLMLAIWGANGYFQSLIWAPVFLIVSQSIPPRWRAKALLLLNTASPAGAMAAYAFSSLMLGRWGWRSVFGGAAVCMGALTAVWIAGCRWAYRGAAPPAVRAYRSERASGGAVRPLRLLLGVMAASGGLCLVLPAMLHGMMKDGITTWLPTYMTEVFSLPAQTAVAFSVLLPAVNMLGAVIAYLLMARMKNEAACVELLFFLAGAGLAMLWLFGAKSPLLTVLLFSAVTAAMTAVNVLLCSNVPARFARLGRAATVSGFYNSCGYIGTGISMYAVAWVSEEFGWGVTQLLWLGACLLALPCCAAGLGRWRSFLAAPGRERGPETTDRMEDAQ